MRATSEFRSHWQWTAIPACYSLHHYLKKKTKHSSDSTQGRKYEVSSENQIQFLVLKKKSTRLDC